jgi:hypothetical protein
MNPPPRSIGVGDLIAKATSAVGIRPCGGCKKRQELLNKIQIPLPRAIPPVPEKKS